MKKLIFSILFVLFFCIFFCQQTKIALDYHNYNPQVKEKIIGAIEIPSLGISNPIVLGITDENLNQKYVAMHTNHVLLDARFGNFILAGHRRHGIFYELGNITVGTEIIIFSFQKRYLYEVVEVTTVHVEDYSYFKEVFNQRILTLITCTLDNKRRLIVIAKEK